MTVDESAGTATLTATLDRESNNTVTVGYATADGTALDGTDYTAASGTLTFTPGDTSKSFTVGITDDTLDEINEAFTASLSSPTNATLGTVAATVTITDNDDLLTISISDVTVNEATGPARFPVTLSAVSSKGVLVYFETGNGMATAGGDYVANAGVVVFDPGTTQQEVVVAITNDNIVEDDETFVVRVLDPVENATIADALVVGTIRNDDAPNIALEDGDGTPFPSGDGSPTTDKSTDFGDVEENGGTAQATFTIRNTGNADLTVASIITNDPQFTVSGFTPSTVIAGGGTASFTVTFDPAALGQRNGIVNVASDDPDPTNYAFAVTGNGVDITPPSVVSFTRSNPTTETTPADELVFAVAFSEAVANVDDADFAVTGVSGATLTVSGSGDTRQVRVSGGDLANFNGTVGLNLSGAQDITDMAGNALPANEPPTDEPYTLQNDIDAPVVQSIALVGTPAANAASITYRVTFNENANNLSTDDFELTVTGTATGTIASVSAASGTSVDVTTNTISGTGSLRLDLLGATDIADDLGNTPPAAFTTGAAHTVDLDAPTVAITTGGVTSFNRGAPGSFTATVTFSEPVTDFVEGELTASNAAVGLLSPASGTGTVFTATITPDGKGDVALDMAAGVAQDASANPNAAAPQVTVTQTPGAAVEETHQVIAEFMTNRTSSILNNQPDLISFLSGTNNAGGGLLGFLAINGNEADHSFRFATALSTIRAATTSQTRLEAAFDSIDGLAPSDGDPSGEAQTAQGLDSRTGSWDVWTEIYGSSSSSETSESQLLVGYLGAHYFISDDVLVGLLGQIDWAEETNSTVNSHTEGLGWMVGLYTAGRVPGHDLLYEARVAYGTSQNDVAPIGTYSDGFEGIRFLATGKVSGTYQLGSMEITPSASMAWYQETQQADTDANGLFIPEQTVSLGELRIGPSISREWVLAGGTTVVPSFGVSGVYTFGVSDQVTPQGFGPSDEMLRARLDAGLDFSIHYGWDLSLSGFYDGLGVEQYQSYGSQAQLTIPLN